MRLRFPLSLMRNLLFFCAILSLNACITITPEELDRLKASMPQQVDSSKGDTPEEVRCYNAVQGKVDWAKSGSNTKTWNPDNVKRLCNNTTDSTQRINCFKSQINNGRPWGEAITTCQALADVQPPTSSPAPSPAPVPAPTPKTQCSSLYQAAWASGNEYRYGHNSMPKITLSNAPSDIDCKRFATLHDGSTYRLYFFKQQSGNTLYQFGFNTSTNKYEYGYNSAPVLKLAGIPSSASTSSFAMLHDGSDYRLYLLDRSGTKLHQFAFNNTSNQYEYGYKSIAAVSVYQNSSFYWGDWGMLHDGNDYRLYVADRRSSNVIYQFAFNKNNRRYEQGYKSIPVMEVKGMPADALPGFGMLHDGRDYRFYRVTNF